VVKGEEDGEWGRRGKGWEREIFSCKLYFFWAGEKMHEERRWQRKMERVFGAVQKPEWMNSMAGVKCM